MYLQPNKGQRLQARETCPESIPPRPNHGPQKELAANLGPGTSGLQSWEMNGYPERHPVWDSRCIPAVLENVLEVLIQWVSPGQKGSN